MPKSALKIALLVVSVPIIIVSLLAHMDFLNSKAHEEAIYENPIVLTSKYSKDDIKQSSYISLGKLEKIINEEKTVRGNSDEVFMQIFPKKASTPIVQENSVLPPSLTEFESRIPSTTKLHIQLYTDIACESLLCNIQKYSGLFPLFIIGLVGLVIIFEHRKTFSRRKITFLFLGTSFTVLFIFILYLFAGFLVVINMERKSAKYTGDLVQVLNDKSAKGADFHTGSDQIAAVLTSNKKAPIIFEPSGLGEVLALYEFHDGKPVTFFQKYILLSALSNLHKSYLPLNADTFLFGDSMLVVVNYDKIDLQHLMPVLSKNIIQTQFSEYSPKVNRNISFDVLDQIEYQEFQELKEEEFKTEVNTYINIAQQEINKINQSIASSNSYKKDIDDYLDEIGDLYKTNVKEPQDEYDAYCTKGYENFPECIALENIIETNKRRLKEAEKKLEEERSKIEQFEKDAEATNAKLKAQLAELNEVLKLIQEHPVNTEYQKGVFFPAEMAIKLRFFEPASEEIFQRHIADKDSDNMSAQTKLAYDHILNGYAKEPTFSQYLMTSLHEYLHATSYYEDYAWPDSLEESLTEYLSLEAGFPYIYDKSKMDRLVYSDNVRLLDEMLRHVDSAKIQNLYFNDKTDRSIRNEFARIYANYNYDTFKTDMDALMYMSYDDISARKELIERVSGLLANP